MLAMVLANLVGFNEFDTCHARDAQSRNAEMMQKEELPLMLVKNLAQKGGTPPNRILP